MKEITIEEAYSYKDLIFIDVRSPSEYSYSTIPGAINLPIFSDQERKDIGITYKANKEIAYEKGLLIGSNKLSDIYKYIKSLDNRNKCKVIVFCSRGGMRSKSIVVNLNLLNINTFQLVGGYKAYRKYILQNLEKLNRSLKYITLHGNTGVGKTDLLMELERQGQPVLNLEELANNRGSIFGSLGLDKPISQKMFDSLLFEKLRLNRKGYFFTESESKRIGNIILPDFLMKSMEAGSHVLVKAHIEERINNLLKDYIAYVDNNKVYKIISNNKYFIKRKGSKWVESLTAYLEEGDYHNFVRTLLVDYYDQLYYYSERKYDPYKYIINNEGNFDKSIDKLISITYNYQ